MFRKIESIESITESVEKGFRFLANEFKYVCASICAQVVSFFYSTNHIQNYSSITNDGPFLTLNLLGEIDYRDKVFFDNTIRSINKNCLAAGSVTLIDAEKTMALETRLNELGIINIAWHNDIIIESNGEKVGISLYNDNQKIGLYSIVKRRKIMNRAGATVTIAYVKKDKNNYNDHKKFLKKIGKAGYSCVVGTTNGLGLKKSMRTFNFSSTHIFYSLGKITNKVSFEKGFRAFPIVRIGVDSKNKSLAQVSYYPSFSLCNGSKFYINEFPYYLGIEDIEYKVNKEIKSIIKSINKCGQEVYLKDIFAAINTNIPKKYEYMLDYTVNKICSRTIEVAPGNVFFYRQQFRDKNDKNIQNETLRLKLIVRVLLRKSLFIFSYRKLWSFVPHVCIDDTIEAHISSIAMIRNKLSTQFIGITGSVGKTSTKDMLYEVFAQKYNTEKSIQNSNVQIKIGLNVQNVKENTEFFIQEIGGGRPGGASRHSRMVSPTAAIVTNIGTAHIGNYESQEDLMYNKLGISEGLTDGGVLFLNGDDELLFNADLSRFKCDVCYYAINNKNADYYAENIIEFDNRTEFDIVHKGNKIHAVVNVLGWHNVLNAVCSFAVGKRFGIEETLIVKGLANFRTSGIRQNLVNVAGYQLFVDCFNASATSVETTLSTLEKVKLLPNRKRVAIIGDITGMGDKLDDINKEVSSIINNYETAYDQLILYGKNGKDIEKGINNKNKVLLMESRNELSEWIDSNVDKGDITLYKGSSKMQLDEIIDDVYGTNLADARYIEESHYRQKSKKGIKYIIFDSYATVRKIMDYKPSIVIKDTISGKPVKKIRTKCFNGNNVVETVTLGKAVVHIGSYCFMNCSNLKEIKNIESIKYLGASAFYNCKKLKDLSIPNKIKVIGKEAFKNCISIETVSIPGTCKTIYRETFMGCSKLNNLIIENGVIDISKEAFKGCKSLESVHFPESVKYIRGDAFSNCKNLKNVYISKNAKVDINAFRGCPNLEITRY